eukprot:CAMPEP_0175359932 /NCGR_PEP_ID=MMETSP0095-20121207/15775_1 /TAXON_ID=311494 /ORGANISM="Alexandrium monilatum, Strain CCMP3105" /LENGTH=40 /DNA_ID= /DNA_START= /DNA_END= /DNA_ORIENTATION=
MRCPRRGRGQSRTPACGPCSADSWHAKALKENLPRAGAAA